VQPIHGLPPDRDSMRPAPRVLPSCGPCLVR